MDCFSAHVHEKDASQPGNPCARIARSYWRCFYPDASERAGKVAAYLRDHGIRVAEDHIVPDKLVAVRAGVGWYGKNGVVQTTRFGSWIILRSLVTNAKMEEDEELKNDCGTCEACIKACPKNKKVAPTLRQVKPIRVSYGTSPSLISLLKVTEKEFQKEFYDLDWAEPKLKYLLRDVAVALGNSEDKSVISHVNKLLKNPDETVRNHASWAAKKLSVAT